jgi:3-oxoacyl-[acyl-carrier-protein] synthase II
MKRVVITGMGAVTPLGNDVQTFWTNLVAGKSGAARITRFDPELFRTQFACEVKDFNTAEFLDKADLRKTDLFNQYALVAAGQAIKESGFDMEKINPLDVGAIIGSGQGGMQTFEDQVKEYAANNFNPRFSPFFVTKLISNMAPGLLSIKYGFMGINYTTVSACSTSNTAIMDAFNYIRLGKAKIIVTGGAEAPITEASFGGFCSMKAMSIRNDDPATASRPFDITRDGFVMGEGAGALVLEEYEHAKARGAVIHAELAGAAMTADAYHITSPHPEGNGAYHGMRLALEDAGINTSEVDHLNAHATSTPVGDMSEINAIARLFGEDMKNLYVTGTKSATGHLLGGAGAIEAVASIMSIKNNLIPPTINTTDLDSQVPASMNIVLGQAIEKKVNVAMSNTFGFGGHNGIVVFKKLS